MEKYKPNNPLGVQCNSHGETKEESQNVSNYLVYPIENGGILKLQLYVCCADLDRVVSVFPGLRSSSPRFQGFRLKLAGAKEKALGT